MGLGLKDMSPQKRIEFGQALKAKPKDELKDFLYNVLNKEEREELLYDPFVFLREDQLPHFPEGKNICLMMCGRGLT